jgi:hypothetical protein
MSKMGRISLQITGILAIFPLATAAAETLSSVRVYTYPADASFQVDGVTYYAPATFMWPAGSKHLISADPVQTGLHIGKRWAFKQWVANSTVLEPKVPSVNFTADPAISSFRAEFDMYYALTLSFNACDGTCFAPGFVTVEKEQYIQDTVLWFEAAKTVTLFAYPNTGYVFVGWIQSEGTTAQGFVNTIIMNGPRSAYPHFEVARRINLSTSPPGLRLLADRNEVITPLTMDWGWNTTHTLAPVSPQVDDHSKVWVFQSWSDTGTALRAYKVAPLIADDSVTATFVPGARISFLTNPPGLKLLVDGKDNWTGVYNFSWGVGETHRVEAPATQTGADGRKYTFKGWSNGGDAAQNVTGDGV